MSKKKMQYKNNEEVDYCNGLDAKKRKILINSIKPRPSNNICMDEWKTLEEVDQFKYLGSTQTKHGTSIKEVKIRQPKG